MEHILKQSHSIVRITEEALASKVAAKGSPEEPHHVPLNLQDVRHKSDKKETEAAAKAKAAEAKAKSERAGLSGADEWSDSRQLTKRQRTGASSSSGVKTFASSSARKYQAERRVRC